MAPVEPISLENTSFMHTAGCPSVPLLRQDLTALIAQTGASRTRGFYGTEGQSPCEAYIRSSTHTDVPSTPFFYSVNAVSPPPAETTAAEANPARSL